MQTIANVGDVNEISGDGSWDTQNMMIRKERKNMLRISIFMTIISFLTACSSERFELEVNKQGEIKNIFFQINDPGIYSISFRQGNESFQGELDVFCTNNGSIFKKVVFLRPFPEKCLFPMSRKELQLFTLRARKGDVFCLSFAAHPIQTIAGSKISICKQNGDSVFGIFGIWDTIIWDLPTEVKNFAMHEETIYIRERLSEKIEIAKNKFIPFEEGLRITCDYFFGEFKLHIDGRRREVPQMD